MALLSLYGWATASLRGQTLNDFASPAGYLTAAVNSLIQNIPADQVYIPSPELPLYLPGDSDSTSAPWGNGTARLPWGNRTVDGTNPYTEVPDTGVTRQYELTIERAIIAPDGFNKSSILINGQYPGPLIEANWGDYIEVVVHNNIAGPEEGTSLHWHGLTLSETPWFDGTPGVSQCPIAPGSSFTYRFRADLYGSSWYHSHFGAQYTAGAYGPMVIYGPSSADYDVDIGPVIIHDYYRQDVSRIVENTLQSNSLTALLNPSDNTFIHGGSNYVCDLGTDCESNKGLSRFNFTSGKRHRLRIINPSSLISPMLFTIDNHTMTVIANDFTPIVPYETNVLSLSAGQRTDIIVEANGAPDQSYYMRIRQPDLCCFVLQPFGLAAIHYENADTSAIPWTLPHPEFNTEILGDCKNDPLTDTVPAYPIAASETPTTVEITANVGRNAEGQTEYTMNGLAFRSNFDEPLLRSAAREDTDLSAVDNAAIFEFGNDEIIRVVFNNNMTFSHPMHLHGQNMVVLAEGKGAWDGTITNPENPQRRDTQIVQARGYAVFEFTARPGVWPFHCHIAWHLSQGMHVNFVTQREQLFGQASDIEDITSQTCDDWTAYSSGGGGYGK